MAPPTTAGADNPGSLKASATDSESQAVDGMNVTRANERTMTLSPLTPTHSPVRPKESGGIPFDESVSQQQQQPIPGLQHPLATINEQFAPPRPPILPTLKDRSVSYAPIMTVDRGDVDDDIVSHMSNPDFMPQHHHHRALTTSDILNDPVASEADAAIQRALDDVDPTMPGPSAAQQSILGFVPEEAEPDAFHDNDDNKPIKPTLARARTTTTPTKSAAEDLFQLASDLSVLNKQHGMSVRGLNAMESLRMDEDEVMTDQDKLMKNAATLMKRNNVSLKDSTSDASKPPAAHDRWAALKTTVHANKSLRDLAKKTDDPDHLVTEGQDVEASKDHEGPEQGDDDDYHDGETIRSNSGLGRSHPMRATTRRQKLKARYKDFEDWMKFQKLSMYSYIKFLLFFLILPAIGIAAILFYLVKNPPCGTADECNNAVQTQTVAITKNSTSSDGSSGTDLVSLTKQIFDGASASWWILFVCCRQPITLSLALATQAFLIDFIALRSKWAVKLVGPFVTLFIVQSKGWPFILFWWGIFDFLMLYGSSKWARHWLFWQPYVDMFNENNPSGSFTSAPEYKTALIVAIVVSVVVAMKRFWVGFWFGKKTYHRYADDLTGVMKKSLLIGQVAALARDKVALGLEAADLGLDERNYELHDGDDEGSKGSHTGRDPGTSPRHGVGPSITSGGGGALMQQANLSSFQKIRINELLGAWEEPETNRGQDKEAPIAAIIQFRQSLSYLNSSFPFSVAFGSATNRNECVASSEATYKRLLGSDNILRFDWIASLAIDRNGNMDEEKLKALIKLFRPDRDGSLGLLDFAKSIDTVYKELRLLRASVANSTRMDASFERLFNIVFYFIIACVVLSALGIDPIVLFASISGFVIGFAFMIGSACAKFVEGVMFITVQQPYDIGDRVNVASPIGESAAEGASGWIVRDVNLYCSTFSFGSTNEVATMSNSSLAACRIINGARSHKASVSLKLKFPLDASYKKLQIYRGAVEEFVKARPREWRTFTSFRAARVEVDLGYVEYSLCAEHREPWQHAGIISQSKADLTSFCLELSKKMEMRYRSPPKPIDLTFRNGGPGVGNIAEAMPHLSPDVSAAYSSNINQPAGRERSNTVESVDWRTVSAMFESKK